MIDTNYFKEYFTNDPVRYILNRSNKPEDIDQYLNSIDNFVFSVRNEIPVAQFKKIYNEIRKIAPDELNKIKIMRIQIAYIAGRNDKSVPTQKFCILLDQLIQNLSSSTLEAFKKFMEAVIAYFKYHNPKAK